MVVCHCEAVNDAAIRAAVASGGDPVEDITIEEIATRCGAGGRCGGCHGTIRAIIARLGSGGGETPVGLTRRVRARRSLVHI